MQQPVTDAELKKHIEQKRKFWQRLSFPQALEGRFQRESAESVLEPIGLSEYPLVVRYFPALILTLSFAITTSLFLLLGSTHIHEYLFFLLPTLMLLGIYSRLSAVFLFLGLLANSLLSQGLLAFAYDQDLSVFSMSAWIWASVCLWMLASLFERIQREQFLMDHLLSDPISEEISHKRQPFLVGLESDTGLSNNLSFERALTTEWKRSARAQRPIALIFIQCISDLTHSDFLAQLGGVLRRYARRPGDIASHLQDQKFAVLLAETELKNAYQVAIRLRDALLAETWCDVNGQAIELGVNLGVYSNVPEPNAIWSPDLMQEAWLTLDAALEDCTNQVVCLG